MQRATLRISDRGGPDWKLEPSLARVPGESPEAWTERAVRAVIATVPVCGGYADDGPVSARRALPGEDGLIVVAVTDDDTGRALACASVTVVPTDGGLI